MKLKCPGCSQLLNVPDSAAGRVVKCPCGKTLRAPAAASSSAVSGSPAPAPSPATTRAAAPPAPAPTSAAPTNAAPPSAAPLAAAPARSAAGVAVGGSLGGDFDLTDTDLEPVRSVVRPGQAKAEPKNNEAELLKSFSKEEGGWANSIEGSHPAALKSMGGWNFVYAIGIAFLVLVTMGFTSMLPVPPELAAIKGIMMAVIGLAGGLDAAFLAAAGVSCFLPYKQCWYYLLFAQTFGLMISLAVFVTSFMYESSVIWKLITASMVLSSGFTLAYLHSSEVRKFYDTMKTPKKYVFLFDGIGGSIGGVLMLILIFAMLGE